MVVSLLVVAALAGCVNDLGLENLSSDNDSDSPSELMGDGGQPDAPANGEAPSPNTLVSPSPATERPSDGGTQSAPTLAPAPTVEPADASIDSDASDAGTPKMSPDGGTPTSVPDGSTTPTGECMGAVTTAAPELQPQDLIIVIDSSGSMDDEIQGLEERINDSLGAAFEASSVDYRIILLGRYGNSEDRGDIALGICVPSPLGGHDCSSPRYIVPDDEDNPADGGTLEGTQPLTHGERFFHHSEYVDSHNALCQLLARFQTAEIATEHGAAFELGWQTSARQAAFKNFLLFTDDRTACSYGDIEIRAGKDSESWMEAIAAGEAIEASELPAQTFDEQLLSLAPEFFGSADDRNYRFFSVVGLSEQPQPLQPYSPDQELVTDLCSGHDNNVISPGLVYQRLSRMTGGLRFPVCEFEDYDAILSAVAAQITEDARPECDWAIPPALLAEAFSPNGLNINLGLGETETVELLRVNAGECGDQEAWYYDDPAMPTRVHACPTTCLRLTEAPAPRRIEWQLGCPTRTSSPD